jgi:hypothetical protein
MAFLNIFGKSAGPFGSAGNPAAAGNGGNPDDLDVSGAESISNPALNGPSNLNATSNGIPTPPTVPVGPNWMATPSMTAAGNNPLTPDRERKRKLSQVKLTPEGNSKKLILDDLCDKKLLDQKQYDERLDQINLAFAANPTPSPSGSTRSSDSPQGTFHSPTGSPTNLLARKLFPGLDKPISPLMAPNSLPGSSLTFDENMGEKEKPPKSGLSAPLPSSHPADLAGPTPTSVRDPRLNKAPKPSTSGAGPSGANPPDPNAWQKKLAASDVDDLTDLTKQAHMSTTWIHLKIHEGVVDTCGISLDNFSALLLWLSEQFSDCPEDGKPKATYTIVMDTWRSNIGRLSVKSKQDMLALQEHVRLVRLPSYPALRFRAWSREERPEVMLLTIKVNRTYGTLPEKVVCDKLYNANRLIGKWFWGPYQVCLNDPQGRKKLLAYADPKMYENLISRLNGGSRNTHLSLGNSQFEWGGGIIPEIGG